MIILIEKYRQYLRVYYDDGHCELIDQSLEEYAQFCYQKNKYKNPILVGDDYLYPTQNKKDEDCRWVNFDYLNQRDNDNLMRILKERDIHEKVVKEFLAQKKKQLLGDGA